MDWTTVKPTKPGWRLMQHRMFDGFAEMPVEIKREGSELALFCFGNRYPVPGENVRWWNWAIRKPENKQLKFRSRKGFWAWC